MSTVWTETCEPFDTGEEKEREKDRNYSSRRRNLYVSMRVALALQVVNEARETGRRCRVSNWQFGGEIDHWTVRLG
jgi:hypothetical protein